MSRNSTRNLRRPSDAWKALAALASLVLMCAVATQGVPSAEVRLFAAVNELPDWLEQTLWLPMQFGSLFGPVLVAVIAWLAWRDWRPALGALVAGVAAWQLAKVVKGVIERNRPHDELVDMVRRGGTPLEGLGFVSGHAAVAFALATVLSPYLSRRWRWATFVLAGVVAVARIHVGAHFPLDVIGGAALGCGVGCVWRLAVGVPAPVTPPDRRDSAPVGGA